MIYNSIWNKTNNIFKQIIQLNIKMRPLFAKNKHRSFNLSVGNFYSLKTTSVGNKKKKTNTDQKSNFVFLTTFNRFAEKFFCLWLFMIINKKKFIEQILEIYSSGHKKLLQAKILVITYRTGVNTKEMMWKEYFRFSIYCTPTTHCLSATFH